MIKKSQLTLNEKDSLQDMLDVEKQMISLYGVAMSEASAKNIRVLLKTNLCETAEDQFQVFKTMQENDYYQVKPANKTVIDEQVDKFREVKGQIKE